MREDIFEQIKKLADQYSQDAEPTTFDINFFEKRDKFVLLIELAFAEILANHDNDVEKAYKMASSLPNLSTNDDYINLVEKLKNIAVHYEEPSSNSDRHCDSFSLFISAIEIKSKQEIQDSTAKHFDIKDNNVTNNSIEQLIDVEEGNSDNSIKKRPRLADTYNLVFDNFIRSNQLSLTDSNNKPDLIDEAKQALETKPRKITQSTIPFPKFLNFIEKANQVLEQQAESRKNIQLTIPLSNPITLNSKCYCLNNEKSHYISSVKFDTKAKARTYIRTLNNWLWRSMSIFDIDLSLEVHQDKQEPDKFVVLLQVAKYQELNQRLQEINQKKRRTP